MRCAACGVDVEGGWAHCPLCGEKLCGVPTPDPLPAVPLRRSRSRWWRWTFLVSVVLILGSLLAQLLLGRGPAGIGVPRSVWFGLSTLWLVVLMVVRKRRNAAKSTVYCVVLVCLACLYFDYLSGWDGWSLTYAVPAVCAGAIVALQITGAALRARVDEHVVYSALTVLLGLTPVAFIALGWVRSALPSLACAAVSFLALVALQVGSGPLVRHELAKRFHL